MNLHKDQQLVEFNENMHQNMGSCLLGTLNLQQQLARSLSIHRLGVLAQTLDLLRGRMDNFAGPLVAGNVAADLANLVPGQTSDQADKVQHSSKFALGVADGQTSVLAHLIEGGLIFAGGGQRLLVRGKAGQVGLDRRRSVEAS